MSLDCFKTSYLLRKVDQILQIRIVAVRRDDLIGERFLQHDVHLVREHKPNDGDRHLAQEEHQETQRVELEQAGVLPQGTQTSGKRNHKHDSPGDDHHERDVQHDVVERFQLDQTGRLPFVHERVEPDSDEQPAKQPEDKVQQEDHVLYARTHVREVVRRIAIRRHPAAVRLTSGTVVVVMESSFCNASRPTAPRPPPQLAVGRRRLGSL